MSLANKYRPQTFDEMVGQEHIIDILKAQMKARDTIHHNYLLFGPRGTGKTTSARLIAKGLNCLDLQDGNPCNHCANCELINNGTTLDYVEIDAASHTGVDNIREEIIEKSLYPPTALKKKIYVIDEVHMLSKGAFNALLKTIEEPKNNVCFIFATTEIHKVPDTIISRCQVFNYRKVPNHAMVGHLEKIVKNENLGYTLPALEIIANISEGCVRDAVKYVDQVSILGDLNEDNVSRFLGVAGESTIKDLLEMIKGGDRDSIFSKLDEIAEQGVDLTQFAKQSIGYLDQHLLEDTGFYLNISEVLGKVLATMKTYPYPLVAYKIAINAYLNGGETYGSSQQTIVKNQSYTTPVSKTDAVINTKKEGKDNHIQDQSSNSQNKETSPSKDEDSPIQVTSTPDSVPSNKTSIKNDFKVIWSNVLKKLDKPTVQSNLKDQAIIEGMENGVIKITVITPLAKMLLNNEENKKQIEQLLSEELGQTVVYEFVYEKKEEYFARKMGL